MKMLSLLVVLLPALAIAGTEYKLDQKTITIGNISHQPNIIIVRTHSTPKRVRLKIPMNGYRAVCEQWESRQVWVPGYWTQRCFRWENNISWSRGECTDWRDHYVDGHYKTETYCAQYGSVPTTYTATLALNFRKARKLSRREKEVFTLDFDRTPDFSKRFEVRANPETREYSYEIKKTGFFRPLFGQGFGLKFIAR